MAGFFQQMDEKYAKKHFPTGSVFGTVDKVLKRNNFAFLIIAGFMIAGCLAGLFWSIGRTLEMVAEGNRDALGIGIGFGCFWAVLVLLLGISFYFNVRNLAKKKEDYIRLSAKYSKLPEKEIEDFDRQAMASDTYILKLTAGLDRLLSSATNKDGLLTRDYIYLASPSQAVMRVKDLKACCFNDYTYYINTGKRSKKIHCLAVTLVSSNGNGVIDTSDTTEEAGRALMALLKERNEAIDTNDGRVLPEEALSDYIKKILEREKIGEKNC
ncbi:MAG: hypothetical protein HFG59_13535 [Lachnospiraceae bacterium]|nr:hypothetical protein [Lachnospiraceae bacterium]